ncbi:MAG: DUF4167 domain-containing protein [Kordiimonadaceae bacterium]|nr:DUF4167 domain-containing protein [Kordiimonadaceae bacterium]MBO6568969.1 DUF4167 domain-containing protein [Kordiimonadaceae bacterium]MBO6965056.1 DUF4167 domain-containing protein [Kordiimonadaceae bacterium]
MKQAQNARKQRGRSNARQNNRSGNQGNRSEQKVRGNPKQLIEKYKNQAREALQAGDRTQAEYFFQFADHYYRVMSEMRGPAGQDGDNTQNNRRRRRGRGQQDDQQPEAQNEAQNSAVENEGESQETPAASNGSDPAATDQPAEVHPELSLQDEAPKPARRRRAPRKKPDAEAAAPTAPAGDVAESDVA